MKLTINLTKFVPVWQYIYERLTVKTVAIMATILSIAATSYYFSYRALILYGDAESHLNIAKRVVHSITPGAAQLGGIWLPVPHILLIPFVFFDPLWRTGLAGAIVSGISLVISSIYLYKTTYLLTNNRVASFLSFLIFATNPNILYMQSTPMTELVLINFFVLSTYYYIRFLKDSDNILMLILAAFFGFIATLSRYDGWFLVLFEAGGILLLYIRDFKRWKEMEGKIVMFCTLAFFGIAIWMLWDLLILGDPFYFTNSQFSAKTQQENWNARGELPAYHNLPVALLYYAVTSMSNAGVIIFFIAVAGFISYLINNKNMKSFIGVLILMVPFIFNVTTLYLGQSVIFIPHITPRDFEWVLFNVRYGVMMIPVIGFFTAYIFLKSKTPVRLLLIGLIFLQFGFFFVGYSKIISLADGTEGLSRAEIPDAEPWLAKEYDGGLVLMDDYARTVSIVRSGIPMQNVIYIGNRGYWDESFYAPEKYAKWIIMQENDAVWTAILGKPHIEARLYKYFNKVYTSPEILIFKRNPNVK